MRYLQLLFSMAEANAPLSKLKNVKCQLKKIEGRPTQPENDQANCGVYVLFYMKHVVDILPTQEINKKRKMPDKFDVNRFRLEVARTLLEQSINVNNRCLHCCKAIKGKLTITCKICLRTIHQNCIEHNEKNTDDENEAQKSNIKKVKRQKLHRIYFFRQ